MKRFIAMNTNNGTNNTNENRKEEKTMKHIHNDKQFVESYMFALERIYEYTHATDPFYGTDDNHSPVMFEDWICCILEDNTEDSIIDIVMGKDDFDDSISVCEFTNDMSQKRRNVYAIYHALETGKKVLVNDVDITTIDFEY